jgi:hypothetical protein
MDKIFQVLAVILGGVAAFFLWQENGENAFVAAALGAVSFFFSIRVQTKRRLNQYEEERLAELEREEYFAELERAGDDFIAFDSEREKVEIPVDRQ